MEKNIKEILNNLVTEWDLDTPDCINQADAAIKALIKAQIPEKKKFDCIADRAEYSLVVDGWNSAIDEITKRVDGL